MELFIWTIWNKFQKQVENSTSRLNVVDESTFVSLFKHRRIHISHRNELFLHFEGVEYDFVIVLKMIFLCHKPTSVSFGTWKLKRTSLCISQNLADFVKSRLNYHRHLKCCTEFFFWHYMKYFVNFIIQLLKLILLAIQVIISISVRWVDENWYFANQYRMTSHIMASQWCSLQWRQRLTLEYIQLRVSRCLAEIMLADQTLTKFV